ncbi:tail tape measure protein [Novosphingobium flavum]|uniref:Tail tape measure protein n=1 Tax=Novosphingobium flavum TaxID=1778672 RepID=A0A7X1FQD6_9SPHN|nr:tail tape measure protein [Novosphingobium flavum]MBC2665046.1 tail tape measure protein [Novosphingobium flavum]
MTDTVDTLMVDVRASTQGFAQDIAAMRSTFDGTLVDGFSRAGTVLERGLVSAVRKGSLSFEDLGKTALNVIDSIAAQALKGALGGTSSSGGGGLLSLGTSLLGAVLGLPGRATGGPVSPGRGYVVGERGPELFVPTSAGRIETGTPGGTSRDVRVAITVNGSGSASGPQALQRSSRQVASAVKRALRDY